MGLYFQQLKAGRDFGRRDSAAQQMNNFIYLIGDTESHEAVVVDPAWDVAAVLDRLDADDMRLTGALVTHYHPDHVGGHLFGHDIAGLAELLAARPVKIYANPLEIEGLQAVTQLSRSDFTPAAGGERLPIGSVQLQFLHTPGHTPGSQCFLVNGTGLVAGDTLFVGACGRVDLPGGDPKAMYESLTQKLAKLPDEVMLYPGHDYGPTRTDTLGAQKHTNPYLQAKNLQGWLRTRGL